ncbi:MAG: DUF1330 domain-containing protein [Cyclobacteriaceae bacterium]|nr:DUF1330 domain-containing protein [Cyclobacteriaceae bacterium]
MPAYIIVEINIHNPDVYEAYKKLTPGSLESYQGKFLVRGGYTECLEGDDNPERLVVLEFPDKETALAWWHSEEYSEAKKIRQSAAKTRMILADGI